MKEVNTQTFRFRSGDKDKKFNSGESYYEFNKKCVIDMFRILADCGIEDFDLIITDLKIVNKKSDK